MFYNFITSLYLYSMHDSNFKCGNKNHYFDKVIGPIPEKMYCCLNIYFH